MNQVSGNSSDGRQTEKIRALFLITLLCVGQKGALAESKPLEVKWSELATLIGGHRVALELTDGLTVKGEVVAVREDAILLDVSSAARGYARGSGSIPRGSVGLINLQRTRGGWGRTMGTVIGVMGGLGVGGYVAGRATSSAGAAIPTFLGIASAISLVGSPPAESLTSGSLECESCPNSPPGSAHLSNLFCKFGGCTCTHLVFPVGAYFRF